MAAGKSQIISFNVGGTLYATSKTTIMRCPDSMLAKMVIQDGLPVLKDDAGNIFIDRDGAMFRYVLNYLRYGEFNLPDSFTGYDQLLREVRFYQLGVQVEELVSPPAVVFKWPNEIRSVIGATVIVKKTGVGGSHTIDSTGSIPPFTSDLRQINRGRFTDEEWPFVYASVIRYGFRPVSGPPGFQTFVLEEDTEEAPRVRNVVLIEELIRADGSNIFTSLPSPSFAKTLISQSEKFGLKKWSFTSGQWPGVYAGVIAKGFRELSGTPDFTQFRLFVGSG